MGYYRRKEVRVDAHHCRVGDPLPEWVVRLQKEGRVVIGDDYVYIPGDIPRASLGPQRWIVMFQDGSVTVYTNDEFERLYERIS